MGNWDRYGWACSGARVASRWTTVVLVASSIAQGQALLWQWTVPAGQLSNEARAVVDLADINGDSVNDVLVSFPFAPNPGGTGYVAVLSGVDGTVIYSMLGTAGVFGLQSPGTIGDVDGDGAGDFLIFHSTSPLQMISGATGQPGPTLPLGPAAAACGIGDVNSDGYGDFAVQGPYPGAVQVFSGPLGTLLYTVVEPVPRSAFGISLEPAPDMNQDGITDFLVGAPGAWWNPNDVGHAYVISGLDGSVVRAWNGFAPQSAFGYSVDTAGDVDGDGVADVLVSAPLSIPYGTDYLYSGSTGGSLATFSNPSASYGITVRGVGDVDGDGVCDYALQGPFPPQQVSIHSGATSALLYAFNDPCCASGSPNINFGSRLSYPGDVNGDGFPDLIVASSGTVFPPTHVYMFSLAPQGHERFGSGCTPGGGPIPIIGGTTIPRLGQTFTVNLSQVPVQRQALLAVGLSNTLFGTTPLPWDLTSLGYSGCSLLVSLDACFPTQTFSRGANGGAAVVSFQIPQGPGYAGLTFYAQWGVEENPGAPGSLAMTSGLQVVLQP